MIKSQDLTFTYPAYEDSDTPSPVLKGLNLTIAHGEFVAILGHNGSGKSTLAQHFNALLTPTTGTLWVNGKDTTDPQNLWDIRQTTGMLFQNPDNQIVASIVEEDVAFGPENLGVPPHEIRTRVDNALATVNMTDYATAPPHNLSGGQKQRVAIAGVLAMAPHCIILDEPTAMLDPSGRKEVLDTVTRLNQETGMTVILITHFMEEAARAKRIIVLEKGQVVMDDTPQAVFAREKEMESLGLGVPKITALAHRLQEKGLPSSHTILTTKEFMAWAPIQAIAKATTHHVTHPEPSPNPSAAHGSPTLSLKNLTHTYSPQSAFEKTAVEDVTLAINKGDMVAIIGHTGSGKSTLIQHLNALLKPTSGTITLNGQDMHQDKNKLKSIRQRVGLVFQYPEHQLFETTIYRDVAFGPTKMGLTPEEINRRVENALEIVGIDKALYEKSPFELSGGQKRRVAIAGVLAMEPEILILDEPAAGLDPGGKDEILSQIKKMHSTLGITVVLVSHSMDDTARLTNRIFVMNRGKLALEGTPQEIFAQDAALRAIGLDTPEISKVFAQLSTQNPQIPSGIFHIEEAASIIHALYKGRNS